MMVFGFKGNQVQLAMTYAALGHQQPGELPDLRGPTLENDRFQAVFVIEMAMHRRHRQVVVIMLHAGQPLGKLALVVVEYVGQGRDAMAGRRIILAVALDGPADQVTHRFRAIAVAARHDQFVELVRERFIQ